ncbi:MAG TPA: carboxypeptidase-like regulatory domain-containing protein [Thermoanaerobaculia bacterium]|jgi:hypothetical protein
MAKPRFGTWLASASVFVLLCFSATAAPDTVQVKVTVRTAGGGSVPAAYVSFVAPDHPGWRPSAEAVAANGVTTLQVRPGFYRVFAGAMGHQDSSRSVEVREAATITFELPPSVKVEGTVVDGSGNPIAGAEVRHLRAVGAKQATQVTEQARRFFAADWKTRTDAEGRWSLQGRSDATIPVLIEARGFAPAHEFRGAASAPVTTLQRGGSLTVTLDRADGDQILSLVRSAADGAAVAPAPWEAPVWSRSADRTTIVWDALPAGRYQVVAHAVDPRHYATPTPLATFTVSPGAAGEGSAALPRLPRLDPDAMVLFVPQRSARELVALQAIASTARGADEVQVALERASGGTLVYLRTKATPDEVFLSTVDTIIAPALAGTGTVDAPLATVTTPRADMTIRLERSDAAPPIPLWSTAHFSGCQTPRPVSLAASPSKDGVLQLPFPTVCRAVVVRLPPFASVVIHASMAPRQVRTFGPYVLTLAASAAIQVVRDPSGAAVAGAPIRAISTPDEPEELVFADGTASADGTLLLTGLPPDRDVILEARDPAADLSGSTRVTVALAETVVARVTVPEPAKLTVEAKLEARVRQRFPEAKVHTVTVDREQADERRLPSDRKSAAPDPAGDVVFSGLRPGLWRTYVLIEAAGAIQPVPLEDVELSAGEEARIGGSIDPPVFEGRVVSGGRAIAAQVGFGSGSGPTSLTRFVRADAERGFFVLLPKPGIYAVTVTPLADQESRIDVGELNLDDPARPLTITLPASAIRVSVRQGGAPAANASITASLYRGTDEGTVHESRRGGSTSSDGELRLESVMPGRWLVTATDPASGRSAETAVDVQPGETATAELELRESSSLAGVVRLASGAPASGATITCLYAGAAGLPRLDETRADGEGRFELSLPTPSPIRLQCAAATPSGHIAPFTTPPAANAVVLMPRSTGSLSIADWSTAPDRDAFWLVSSEGQGFNLGWGAATLRIAAGDWRLVRVSRPDELLRLAAGAPAGLDTATRLRIQPGEVKTIRLQPKSTSEENEGGYE